MWWLICSSLGGLAWADSEKDSSRWSTSGEIRAAVKSVDAFAVDALGTTTSQDPKLSSRIIAGGGLAIGTSSRFDAEIEWSHPQWTPRKARFTTTQSWGKLSIGADTFGWGNGILAHDGRTESHFGDPEQGNVVGRISYALRPSPALKPWSVFLAGDVVIRDENAELFAGDLARQVVLGSRWAEDDLEVGVLALVRWQRDRRDPAYPSDDRAESVAVPVDVFVSKTFGDESDTLQTTIRSELAHVSGSTDRLWNGETGDDGGHIRSLGMSTTVSIAHTDSGVALDTEVAYASGDNDTYDDVSRTFTMHSDHKLGLILFDEVLPQITSRSVEQVSDPGLIAQPPSGLRFTQAKGGLTNAVVINPVLVWETEHPVSARVGWLQAWTAGDWADVYQTATQGGYNTTPGGQTPGSRDLGGELDAGLRYSPSLGQHLTLGLAVEGGIFFPGQALDGVMNDPVKSARLRAAVQW